MIALTDTDLYRRGIQTLLASWEEYARGASGASVERFAGRGRGRLPERARARRLQQRRPRARSRGGRSRTTRSMPWRPPTRRPASRASLPGCTRATRRCAAISNGVATRSTPPHARWACRSRTSVRPGRSSTSAYWSGPSTCAIFGLPPGLLAEADHAAFHLLVARVDGESVATALAFDFGRDCGIYNVTTLESARRRGLGTALTVVALHEARARGCRTASLQSTEMAERMYAAVGFRDLGRFLEYVP